MTLFCCSYGTSFSYVLNDPQILLQAVQYRDILKIVGPVQQERKSYFLNKLPEFLGLCDVTSLYYTSLYFCPSSQASIGILGTTEI